MSYDLIELTLLRLGEQLPERLSPCLESHQTDRRSDKIRSRHSSVRVGCPKSARSRHEMAKRGVLVPQATRGLGLPEWPLLISQAYRKDQ